MIREDAENGEEEFTGESCHKSARSMEPAALVGDADVRAEVGFAVPRMNGAGFEKLDLAASNAKSYLQQRGSGLAASNAKSYLENRGAGRQVAGMAFA